jgi:hypothetical protein
MKIIAQLAITLAGAILASNANAYEIHVFEVHRKLRIRQPG